MPDPTVYIVDDDPDMRDSLRWLLKTVGLRSVTFSSAGEFSRGSAGKGPPAWSSTCGCRGPAGSTCSRR